MEGLRTDSLYIGPFRVSRLLSLAALMALCLLLARRRGGFIRFLPVFIVLLLGVGLAYWNIPIQILLALILLFSAAKLYSCSADPKTMR